MGQVTTVTIAGVVYSIYGERDPNGATPQMSAGEYLNADPEWAATWTVETPDDQSRALVKATRYLDGKRWAGTQTDTATPQPLQWPRTGVTRADGTAVDSATVPDEIVFATYLLAAMLAADPEALNQTPAQAANIQYVKAGSAEVRFQRVLSTGIFPAAVQDLIGQFLAGASPGTYGFGIASGVNDQSSFDEASDFYLVGGVDPTGPVSGA